MLYTISKKGYPKKLSTIPTWKLDKQRLEQSIASRKINFQKNSWNWHITLMPATFSQILTIPTWKLDEQRLQQSIASRKINFHLSIMSSWIACWYSRSPGSRIVLKSRSNSLASHNIRTYNKFIRCFHQFVSRNFFHEFFSVWAVEKGNKLLIGSKQLFFLSLPVEKQQLDNKYLLQKFVDSEFEIGETIWWTTPYSLCVECSFRVALW